MKPIKHTISVPIYLLVDLTDKEIESVDIDSILEDRVIDKYKTYNNEFHIAVDMLCLSDWDIYETHYGEDNV